MAYLKCSKCGSENFKNACSSTLMGGPVNYWTYICAECGNHEKVKRVDTRYNKHKIVLGEADEVVTGGEKK